MRVTSERKRANEWAKRVESGPLENLPYIKIYIFITYLNFIHKKVLFSTIFMIMTTKMTI